MIGLLPPQPYQCAICRRPECGLGYAPAGKRTTVADIIWTCEACIGLARTRHHMATDFLTLAERDSLLDGGDRAGAYADSIGKTDLALMTPEEWQEFLTLVLNGYSEGIRKRLELHAPPF